MSRLLKKSDFKNSTPSFEENSLIFIVKSLKYDEFGGKFFETGTFSAASLCHRPKTAESQRLSFFPGIVHTYTTTGDDTASPLRKAYD